MQLPNLQKAKISIIGLGYVGLPLAIELAKTNKCKETGKTLNREVIGFDLNQSRLQELRDGFDRTNEISSNDLKKNTITYTNDEELIIGSDVFIVTVPTPINEFKEPDLSALELASETVGKALRFKSKSIKCLVIYESTVFPGATEEICIPILEKFSQMTINEDFCCGYSPERINPGDKNNRINNITKVTSGSDIDSAEWINSFYASIIEAGTYKAQSIKVAEAAKVIENTQRDINIALVNEFSIIFNRMNIDTLDVLDAASSKWNFLNFRPGLVGGHCIGIDPYYLTWKSKQLGYNPEVVLSGRKVNEKMEEEIYKNILIKCKKENIEFKSANVLILGYTFKENCPDIRNTKVINLIKNFSLSCNNISVFDPIADTKYLQNNIQNYFVSTLKTENKFDIVLLIVPHKIFCDKQDEFYKNLLSKNGFIYDLKGVLRKKKYIIRP